MPRFVQLSGDRAGESYPADEGAILGRDSSCELSFAEGSISRRHARLIYLDGNWQLIDMESRNGLFFKAERVPSCILHGGEEIRLGKLRLRFHVDGREDLGGDETGEGDPESDEENTHQINSTRIDATPKMEGTGLATERRAARIASMQRGSAFSRFGWDLAQRPSAVRWSVYLGVLALAVGACLGAFLLAQRLRS